MQLVSLLHFGDTGNAGGNVSVSAERYLFCSNLGFGRNLACIS